MEMKAQKNGVMLGAIRAVIICLVLLFVIISAILGGIHYTSNKGVKVSALKTHVQVSRELSMYRESKLPKSHWVYSFGRASSNPGAVAYSYDLVGLPNHFTKECLLSIYVVYDAKGRVLFCTDDD